MFECSYIVENSVLLGFNIFVIRSIKSSGLFWLTQTFAKLHALCLQLPLKACFNQNNPEVL